MRMENILFRFALMVLNVQDNLVHNQSEVTILVKRVILFLFSYTI